MVIIYLTHNLAHIQQSRLNERVASAEIFTLCEFAKVDGSGALTIVGVVDAWFSDAYPSVMSNAYLALRLRFDESGEKKIRFSVSDADLNPITEPAEFLIKITLPGDASTETFSFGGPVPPLELSRSGLYSLEIHVDGESVASIPLYARVIGGPVL